MFDVARVVRYAARYRRVPGVPGSEVGPGGRRIDPRRSRHGPERLRPKTRCQIGVMGPTLRDEIEGVVSRTADIRNAEVGGGGTWRKGKRYGAEGVENQDEMEESECVCVCVCV